MNVKMLGTSAEKLARNYLTQNGYQIEAQNYYTRHGEIDIIAKKDGQYRFIEVKARSGNRFGEPAEAVDRRKILNMHYAAMRYISAQKIADCDFHFDVIEIRINYLRDAF